MENQTLVIPDTVPDSPQKPVLEKFYREFNDKFNRFPDQKGVTRVIEAIIGDVEGKWVHQFFSTRSYAHLTELLGVQRYKWKNDQIIMALEAISQKRFSLAENLMNELHQEGLVDNKEYMEFFNEKLEPAKAAHIKEFEEAQKAEAQKVNEDGAVKDERDYKPKRGPGRPKKAAVT